MNAASDRSVSTDEPECPPAPASRLRIGLLGLGLIGQAVARTANAARNLLQSRGIELDITAALVRELARPREAAGFVRRITNAPEDFFGCDFDIVVEVLGGVEPARTHVARVLESGTPVVTANKSLIAAHGAELAELAARKGTWLRYEASVLAGVPFLGTLERRPLAASVDRIIGIVNGTTNFILTSMRDDNLPFDAALRKAQELGFAEPDPANDLRGVDAVEKLRVLLQQFGPRNAHRATVETTGIEQLSLDDLLQARACGGEIKPIVYAEWGEAVEAFVGPAFLPREHTLARIDGRLNGLCLRSRSAGDLFYSGPGAGPDVTSATILDDVVEVAELLRSGATPRPTLATNSNTPSRSPRTGWFVRLSSASGLPHGVELAEFLGAHGIWASRTKWRKKDGREILYLLAHPCSRECLEHGLSAVSAATGCETFFLRSMEA